MSVGRSPHRRIGSPISALRRIALVTIVALAIPGVAGAERPVVARHSSAYRDQPPLAFVSNGHVFVLDGTGHPPRPVDGATGACCVAWAPDGVGLAFQRGSELWVSQAEAGGIRRVARRVRRWAWAPDGEALAVIPDRTGVDGATGIDFYAVERPHARVTLLPGYRILDFAWAGLGRRIAVTAVRAGGRVALFMLEVAGPYGDCAALCPEPAQPVALDPIAGDAGGVYLAGWSPTVSTLALWTGSTGAGTPGGDLALSLVSPGGGATTPIARTVVNRSWIRWSPEGDRLLVVEGKGNVASPYVLKLCAASLGCRALTRPAASVVDPAWSRAGRVASVVTTFPVGEATTGGRSVDADRSLWVADGDGGAGRVVASGAVSAPQWLPDARHLLFVRDRTLWLVDSNGGAPAAIAGPLGHGRSTPSPTPRDRAGPSALLEDGERLFTAAP